MWMAARLPGVLASGLVLVAPRLGWAHDRQPPTPHDLWRAWSLEPAVIAAIVLAITGYVVGMRRLGRGKGAGRNTRARQSWAFTGGILALIVALVSPLAALGSALFSAHMLQHVVLMLIAAPLLVIARPLAPWIWALPARWRRPVARGLVRRPVRLSWRTLSHPLTAWLVHAAALWVWHAPALYNATLRSDTVHTAQHASFFGSSILFWGVLVQRRHRRAVTYAFGLLYLFTTAVHGNALGALLTFAPEPWYTSYAHTAAWWGLTALEDQQIGGLIMWVPASVVYLGTALALVPAWLRAVERDTESRRSAATLPARPQPHGATAGGLSRR